MKGKGNDYKKKNNLIRSNSYNADCEHDYVLCRRRKEGRDY